MIGHIHHRSWFFVGGFFIFIVGALVAFIIINDRTVAMRLVEAQTTAMASMILAHGETVIGDAEKVVHAIDDDVRRWDFENVDQGRVLFEHLRTLVSGSQHISSAWVLDASGRSRLDTWSFPANPIDGAQRPYFLAHLARSPQPVVLGDPRPGGVSGKERFTVSRTQINDDGSLRAVLVVAIYTSFFSTLYQGVATWPNARAGLFAADGSVLGRLERGEPRLPQYLNLSGNGEAQAPAKDTKFVRDANGLQFLAWRRSTVYPQIYGGVSQSVDSALADWLNRSIVLGLTALLACGSFIGLMFYAARALAAQEKLNAQDLMAREVHHRVKNSLQIIAGMVQIRRRQAKEEREKSALDDVGGQLAAVAKVHELLQSSMNADDVNT